MSRRAVVTRAVAVAIFIGLLVAIYFFIVGFPANPMTPEQMQALLRREVPMGSSTVQVDAWLDAHKMEHSTEDHMTYAILRDTSRGPGVSGFIKIRFVFDKSGHLVNKNIEEDAYGL